MDKKQCFYQIKELGNINNKKDLSEYCVSNIDQILKHLPAGILNTDGGYIIECILKGLSEDSQNKIKIIELVLTLLREKPMPLTYCGDIVSRISLELSRLPIKNVLNWSNDSVQSILNDTDVNMVWRDILPECLNVICTYKSIKHYNAEMSGVEYKVQCIHTLCQCPWKEKQLVQLTAMFKDMQLSKENHKQVVNKICSYIVKLSPDTLPPLVPHLLSLCKIHNLEIVLSHLSNYFNLYLYNKLEVSEQDSESTTMDIDDIAEYSPVELSQCLSTCLYHFSQGMADPELIRKHIKQWPKTQLLRCPFIIDVALAISVKGSDFKTVCLDVIKSAIELQIQDELRSKESVWVSSVLTPDVDVASVLKALATESANHRQLTVLGLIELSFCLLRVRSPDCAPRCRSLGRMVLVALCKAQPETASHILSQLADNLVGDTSHTQYADCLHALCERAPVSVERCSQVTLIVEGCQGPDASQTYEALRPLLAFSERTRDTLVKVCRKHLYSRDSQHRRLAVSGLLTVVRYTRLSGSWQRSQAVADEHSYLTQLTVDLHLNHQGTAVTSRARNEIVCLEIISILRRCFVQDAAVKQFLYNEIYSCVKDKKSLHEPILELLYEHLSKYIPEDDEQPLLLDECITKNGILSEPIGHLLFTIAQFLQTEEEESDDVLDSQSDNPVLYLKNKLTTIMQKLCQADWLVMIDKETPISDLTPESKIKSLKVQQILQCYEALIAHQVMQWNSLNANANSVHSMLKAYNELLESTKVPSKFSKKAKLNETGESRKSPKKTKKSQKSAKEPENGEVTENKPAKKKGKAPVTLASASKDKAGPFKPLPCLWDLQLSLRVLELLYSEEVSWSAIEQRNQIRSKREFHIFALRSIHSIINDKMDRRLVSTLVLKSAALLYSRCISRFNDVYGYDEHVTFACLELFKTCLSTLLSHNYTFKTETIILGIAGSNSIESKSLADILDALHSSLSHLEKENAEVSLDAVGKKTFVILVQITTMFLDMPVKACSELSEVVVRVECLWRASRVCESQSLCAGVLRAGARGAADAPLLERLLARLATALEYISDEETPLTQDTQDFPCIDSKTGHAMLALLCTHLGERYKYTEHLLERAKDLSNAVGYATETRRPRVERELREVYSSVQTQLCQLSSWTGGAARLRCVIGAGSDKVLALCIRLYKLLAAFVKQLGLQMAQTIHLELLLKLAGRKLSHVCDDLVTYVTESQNPRTVLRDTKLLPRLVKEAEAFNANVMLMKHNEYQKYLSLGTARDFRIKAISQQRIKKLEPSATQETVDDDDALTVVLGSSNLEETDKERLSCVLLQYSVCQVVVRVECLWRASRVCESQSLCAGVLRAGARGAADAPLLERLLARLATALEYISDEETPLTQDTEDFPCIDSKTGHAMLALLCTHLGERYKYTEHLLERAKDLSNAVGYATETRRPRVERELREVYSSVQTQLCQLSSWTGGAARLRCVIGAGSDKVLALCIRLYKLLAAFVKQLGLQMAQTIHLELLLKLAGRKLSHVCDDLVTYVTESQNPRTVLRDTKLLPRLVKEAEAFNANVMLMKHNEYQKYLSLGTARDFRIKAISQQRIEELEPSATQETVDDDDALTVVLGNSNLEETDLEDSDLEEEIGGKKRRTS